MNITTHLFVGPPEETEKAILKELGNYGGYRAEPDVAHGAKTGGYRGKNSHNQSSIWISPEKSYTLSDLNIIFEKTRFSLAQGEKCFFILQKTDTLSPVCANRLLKILEEPPPGYFFFLTTPNEESIIATIRSRCLIHNVHTEENDNNLHFLDPLLLFFVDKEKQNDPFLFEQELRKSKQTEQQAINLVQKLAHMMRKKRDKKKIAFFENALKKPPQPGGASLFWKKLFLTFPR